MLYEVITQHPPADDGANLAEYGLGHPQRRGAILHRPGCATSRCRRITSYNVCYTKLLREGKQGLAAGDVDMAAAFAAQVGNLALHPVHVGKLVAYMLNQQLASGRQAHATRQTLEDRYAEIFFSYNFV